MVVYIEGRPLDKRWAHENADALLTLWYPGGEGGRALADVLLGRYNPAGRLSVSVPRSVGQIPVYYIYGISRHGNDSSNTHLTIMYICYLIAATELRELICQAQVTILYHRV